MRVWTKAPPARWWLQEPRDKRRHLWQVMIAQAQIWVMTDLGHLLLLKSLLLLRSAAWLLQQHVPELPPARVTDGGLGGVGVHLPHGPPASRNQVKGELGPERRLTRCITPYARDATAAAAAVEMLRDPSRTARVLEKRAGFSRRAQSAAERSV